MYFPSQSTSQGVKSWRQPCWTKLLFHQRSKFIKNKFVWHDGLICTRRSRVFNLYTMHHRPFQWKYELLTLIYASNFDSASSKSTWKCIDSNTYINFGSCVVWLRFQLEWNLFFWKLLTIYVCGNRKLFLQHVTLKSQAMLYHHLQVVKWSLAWICYLKFSTDTTDKSHNVFIYLAWYPFNAWHIKPLIFVYHYYTFPRIKGFMGYRKTCWDWPLAWTLKTIGNFR